MHRLQATAFIDHSSHLKLNFCLPQICSHNCPLGSAPWETAHILKAATEKKPQLRWAKTETFLQNKLQKPQGNSKRQECVGGVGKYLPSSVFSHLKIKQLSQSKSPCCIMALIHLLLLEYLCKGCRERGKKAHISMSNELFSFLHGLGKGAMHKCML